jgi:hypothetical protein
MGCELVAAQLNSHHTPSIMEVPTVHMKLRHIPIDMDVLTYGWMWESGETSLHLRTLITRGGDGTWCVSSRLFSTPPCPEALPSELTTIRLSN